MLFLWYPKCTTCQKAKAFLDERGVSYEARDIKLENPTAEELRAWWQKSGLPLKKFFNTSGLQYKALGLKDKLPEMSEEEQLALLATDGMLVKRPILVGEDFVRTGFRQAEWETVTGMIQRYDFAPLDGITKVVFRQVYHRLFGGADRYFIPFFSPTDQHILTKRDQRELDPAANAGLPVVPQVMTRRAPDFLWAAEVVADMGYTEVNLNLGCPSGTVTAKGKGSGFLARPEELERFFDEVFASVKLPVSVKTRLGVKEPEEFERLLEIYNRYPIACLTIHPRIQKQFYKGTVHRDWFAWAAERSRNPLCYNGDLVTVEDCGAFAADFPAVDAVMIGRGAIADPALLRKLHGGAPATRQEIQDFTRTLYQSYQDFYGQVGPAAQRMKEVWFFLIHLFEGGERHHKKMRRLRTPAEYEAVEAAIFRELPLRDHAEGAFG